MPSKLGKSGCVITVTNTRYGDGPHGNSPKTRKFAFTPNAYRAAVKYAKTRKFGEYKVSVRCNEGKHINLFECDSGKCVPSLWQEYARTVDGNVALAGLKKKKRKARR